MIIFGVQHRMRMCLLAASTVVTCSRYLFKDGPELGSVFVDPLIHVRDVLSNLLATPATFTNLTNFKLHEFRELCNLVCPFLENHARLTGFHKVKKGRPSKLSPEQRVLCALLYLKHDNSVHYEGFTWNWSKSSLSDDILFVCSISNEVCKSEISWPDDVERRELGQTLQNFPGCIRFIDGTLVRI